jgi:hypothetical protein
MAEACYSIEKDSVGWVIRASGEAILICKEKRMAINIARYAGRLLFLHGEISEHDIEPSMSRRAARGARRTADAGAARLKIVQ